MDDSYDDQKRVIESLCEVLLDAVVIDRLSPKDAELRIGNILLSSISKESAVSESGPLNARTVTLRTDDYEQLNNRYARELLESESYQLRNKIKPRKSNSSLEEDPLKMVWKDHVVRLMDDLGSCRGNVTNNALELENFFSSYGLDFQAKTLSNWWYAEKQEAANT